MPKDIADNAVRRLLAVGARESKMVQVVAIDLIEADLRAIQFDTAVPTRDGVNQLLRHVWHCEECVGLMPS
jgi:hypothetical protein